MIVPRQQLADFVVHHGLEAFRAVRLEAALEAGHAAQVMRERIRGVKERDARVPQKLSCNSNVRSRWV